MLATLVLIFLVLGTIVIPLLAPAAEKLGIDLICFACCLEPTCRRASSAFRICAVLFARHRSAGPSSDIYWGAIPWVVLQLIPVAIVIHWPQSVTYWIDSRPKINPSEIEIRIIPKIEFKAPDFGLPSVDDTVPPKPQ